MTTPAHAYASPADVYRESGMGAAAFVSRPRPVDPRAGDAFDPTTGTFSIIGHGYEADDIVRLVLVASGGALPGGATSTPVYALPLDFFRFRVSATANGAPLTFSDAGSGWGVQVNPEPRLLRLARSVSSLIDECSIAHVTPFGIDPVTGRYPEIIVGVAARMVARRYLPTMMSENPAFRATFEALSTSAAFDGDTAPPAQPGSLLGDWKAGKPIDGMPLAQMGRPRDAARGRCRAPAGWGARGGM